MTDTPDAGLSPRFKITLSILLVMLGISIIGAVLTSLWKHPDQEQAQLFRAFTASWQYILAGTVGFLLGKAV